jgi:micrococcal nuclease
MTAPQPSYVYRGALVRVVDGDTVIATLSLGCHVHRVTTLRLLGINAPELHGPTAAAGQAAKAWATAWLLAAVTGDEWPLVIATQLDSDDRYGRLLATIYRGDGTNLNQALIDAGHAVPWDGRGPRP